MDNERRVSHASVVSDRIQRSFGVEAFVDSRKRKDNIIVSAGKGIFQLIAPATENCIKRGRKEGILVTAPLDLAANIALILPLGISGDPSLIVPMMLAIKVAVAGSVR